MGAEHDTETVWRAQELYCVERLSFDAVARETGVAASTLKRWSEKMGWRAKREGILRDELDLRENKLRARAVLLQKLINDGTPQDAFAVASLESLALREAEARRKIESLRKKEAEAEENKARRAEEEARLEDERKARRHGFADANQVRADEENSRSDDNFTIPRTDAERLALLQTLLDRELAALLRAPAGDLLAGVEKLQKGMARLKEMGGAEEAAAGVSVVWADDNGDAGNA